MSDSIGFVDINTHIIPFVDGGLSSVDKSLKLVGKAYEEGVRTVIATPQIKCNNHSYDLFDWYRENALFEEVKEKAEILFPDMKIYQGAENIYIPDGKTKISDSYFRPMADSQFVLLNLPSDMELDDILSCCRDLKEIGSFPILANGEKYRNAIRKMSDAEKLIKAGVFIQMNSIAVLSQVQKRTIVNLAAENWSDDNQFRFCRKLVKEGFVCFMGTGCSEKRNPVMNRPYEIVKDLTTKGIANDLFKLNAQRLILSGGLICR